MRHLAGDLGAVELHRSGIRPDHVVDEVERRRLAGSVRPDEGSDGSFLDIEAGIVHRLDATESLVQVPGLEHHAHNRPPTAVLRRNGLTSATPASR